MGISGSSFGDDFRLTLLTNDPSLAAAADLAGVNQIGIDVESIGKSERQPSLNARISGHKLDDLSRIAPRIRNAKLFVRINPIHSGTQKEIETALDLGAELLMLPNFATVEEVATFVNAVHGRAWTIILVETPQAATRIRNILAVPGIDEVMVGLNDLHLGLGVSNHFEVLASPLVEMLAAEVLRKGLPFGVGALPRIDDESLEIAPDLVYPQYPRLGATAAWLARVFTIGVAQEWDMREAVLAARRRLTEWSQATGEELETAREELARRAARWSRNQVIRSGHTG